MNSSYVLITGGSSGIGKSLAKVFASKNYSLILIARRSNKLEEIQKDLVSKFNIEVRIIKCDLTKEKDFENLIEYIEKEKLQVSTLINNAGVGDFTLFRESEQNKNQQVIDLNIRAMVRLTHYFLPGMIKNNHGNILNIASMAAYMPGPYIAVYAAAKAFVLSFTHALASENKQYSLNISVLSPGDIETEFQKNAGLEGFEVRSKISVDELAEFAFTKFMIEKEREIIPPDTAKMIEMMNRSGKSSTISDNMFNLRKQLANKLGK